MVAYCLYQNRIQRCPGLQFLYPSLVLFLFGTTILVSCETSPLSPIPKRWRLNVSEPRGSAAVTYKQNAQPRDPSDVSRSRDKRYTRELLLGRNELLTTTVRAIPNLSFHLISHFHIPSHVTDLTTSTFPKCPLYSVSKNPTFSYLPTTSISRPCISVSRGYSTLPRPSDWHLPSDDHRPLDWPMGC